MGRRRVPGKPKSSQARAPHPTIAVALIGLIGTLITALVTYLAASRPTEVAIAATQTAQAFITQSAPQAGMIPPSLVTPFPLSTAFSPDLILGTWESEYVAGIIPRTHRFEVRTEQFRDECYVGTQASATSQESYVGEIIMEFCYDTEAGNYRGRHIWGGGKSSTTFWGEDEGLTIVFTGSDSVFVQYNDSIYTGGWVYQRTHGD
jgi:hypothetical protein